MYGKRGLNSPFPSCKTHHVKGFRSVRGKPRGLDVAEAAVQAGSCGRAGGKLEGLQSSVVQMSCLYHNREEEIKSDEMIANEQKPL